MNRIWQECDVISQVRHQLQKTSFAQFIYPDIDPLGTITNPIYLYVFPGDVVREIFSTMWSSGAQ